MILKSTIALLLILCSGCASPRTGQPVHALISIEFQFGGSDTTIYVSEEQYGAGNEITKDFPFKASVSDPTEVKVVP